jgi:anti-sigma factor RsiW
MPGPLTDDNLLDDLLALMAGELDAAQAQAVLTRLAGRPDAAELLRRAEARAAMMNAARRATDIQTPATLRADIEAMLERETAATAPMPLPITRSRRPWRALLAVAAGIGVGVMGSAWFYSTRPSPPAREVATTQPQGVLPDEWLVRAGRIHGECSRLPEGLHAKSFAATDATLSAAVKVDLRTQSDAPDLTAAEFKFAGAGPCPASRYKTSHLLYRSTRQGSYVTVSLFAQVDVGQFEGLESGRVYRASPASAPYPILAWRSGGVVYFLVGDSNSVVNRVLQVLKPTPVEQIVQVARAGN